MIRISLLRPVLASIEPAQKANIARRQGLKPARRPAAKTVAAEDIVRSLRASPVAHNGAAVIAICNIFSIEIVYLSSSSPIKKTSAEVR